MRRFGRQLRIWRRAAGLSQPGLAEAVGVSQSTVSAWETGPTCPKRRTVPALAEAVGVSVEEVERALTQDAVAAAAGVPDPGPDDHEDRLAALEAGADQFSNRLRDIEAALRRLLGDG